MTRNDAVRGFLASVGVDPQVLVEFQYNPAELTDKRSVGYAALDAPGALAPTRQYTSGGDRTLSFTVTVDGGQTYGPFEAGTAARVEKTDLTGRVLRIDAVSTTGGNTGAAEIEVVEAP